MGCWNQTCGLSQIHIRAGEKVIVFPVAEGKQSNLCYTTPFWAPFVVPFYSEYNDYGGGENSSGIGLELILDYLRKNAVEVEQGPNEYHDCPVERANIDEDKFWDAIHEQRLKIYDWGKREAQVGFVMVKESIYEHLAANFKLESYLYEESRYDKFTFNELLADVDGFVDHLINGTRRIDEFCDETTTEEEKESMLEMLFLYEPVERAGREIKNKNRAARWLSYSSSHLKYGGFLSNDLDEMAIKYIKAKDAESLKTLLVDHLKLLFIDTVMISTRKFWSPQAGAGSQGDDTAACRELIAAMNHVLDADDRRWEEDDEFEEDGEDDREEDE